MTPRSVYKTFKQSVTNLLAGTDLWQIWISGDKIKKNEMGGACSVYGGEERRIQGFDGET
jgi:hypothetical protein